MTRAKKEAAIKAAKLEEQASRVTITLKAKYREGGRSYKKS